MSCPAHGVPLRSAACATQLPTRAGPQTLRRAATTRLGLWLGVLLLIASAPGAAERYPDFDYNGHIDETDARAFADAWNAARQGSYWDVRADTNGDALLDHADAARLIEGLLLPPRDWYRWFTGVSGQVHTYREIATTNDPNQPQRVERTYTQTVLDTCDDRTIMGHQSLVQQCEYNEGGYTWGGVEYLEKTDWWLALIGQQWGDNPLQIWPEPFVVARPPLVPGTAWQTTITMGGPGGSSYPVPANASIVAVNEPVKVPAGTFKCTRIEIQTDMTHFPGSPADWTSQCTITFWLAPGDPGLVKSETYADIRRGADRFWEREVDELLSYTPGPAFGPDEIEQHCQLLEEEYDALVSRIAELGSFEQAMAQTAESLVEKPGVLSADLSGSGFCIDVVFDDRYQAGIRMWPLPTPEPELAATAQGHSWVFPSASDTPASGRALILDCDPPGVPLHNPYLPGDRQDYDWGALKQKLEEMGWQVDLVRGATATVDVFKRWNRYGLVILNSHGHACGTRYSIATGESLKKYRQPYREDLDALRLTTYVGADGVTRYCVTHRFFQHYYLREDMTRAGTVVLTSCCSLTQGDALAAEFFLAHTGAAAFGAWDREAIAYRDPDDEVPYPTDFPAMGPIESLLSACGQGLTLGQAEQQMAASGVNIIYPTQRRLRWSRKPLSLLGTRYRLFYRSQEQLSLKLRREPTDQLSPPRDFRIVDTKWTCNQGGGGDGPITLYVKDYSVQSSPVSGRVAESKASGMTWVGKVSTVPPFQIEGQVTGNWQRLDGEAGGTFSGTWNGTITMTTKSQGTAAGNWLVYNNFGECFSGAWQGKVVVP